MRVSTKAEDFKRVVGTTSTASLTFFLEDDVGDDVELVPAGFEGDFRAMLVADGCFNNFISSLPEDSMMKFPPKTRLSTTLSIHFPKKKTIH
jgi:hypothetical protein